MDIFNNPGKHTGAALAFGQAKTSEIPQSGDPMLAVMNQLVNQNSPHKTVLQKVVAMTPQEVIAQRNAGNSGKLYRPAAGNEDNYNGGYIPTQEAKRQAQQPKQPVYKSQKPIDLPNYGPNYIPEYKEFKDEDYFDYIVEVDNVVANVQPQRRQSAFVQPRQAPQPAQRRKAVASGQKPERTEALADKMTRLQREVKETTLALAREKYSQYFNDFINTLIEIENSSNLGFVIAIPNEGINYMMFNPNEGFFESPINGDKMHFIPGNSQAVNEIAEDEYYEDEDLEEEDIQEFE